MMKNNNKERAKSEQDDQMTTEKPTDHNDKSKKLWCRGGLDKFGDQGIWQVLPFKGSGDQRQCPETG